jgi:catechol 2,3-dioxygenase-like lactoylglutathione lyase family enzyme
LVEIDVMPKLLSSAPTFLVPDVETTARWYELHLGFHASFFPKDPPFVYASVHRDGVEIMLLRQEGYHKPEVTRVGGVWDVYFRTEGLLEYYEEVRARIPLKSGLTKRPYGDTEFEVMDPNGYVLVFGEII